MAKYSVGIIGTGKIAGLCDYPQRGNQISNHAQAVYNNSKLEMTSAFDCNRKNLETFCKVWKIKDKFTDLSEYLDTELPDIVSICTPDETHFEIGCRILSLPNPPRVLFMEKPVVTTRKELHKFLNVAEKSNTVVVVNHKRRMTPVHKRTAKIISSGLLGEILEGRFVYYGGWLHNGVHLMDLIVMLFGDKFGFRGAVRRGYGENSDLCIDVSLEFKSFKIRIDSFDEKYYQLFEGELRFSKGRVLYNDFCNKIIIEKVKKNKIGELELKPLNNCNFDSSRDQFVYVYDAITKYLETGNRELLNGVLLKDAAVVMKKMFMFDRK